MYLCYIFNEFVLHSPIHITVHCAYRAGFDSHRYKNRGWAGSIHRTTCKYFLILLTKNSYGVVVIPSSCIHFLIDDIRGSNSSCVYMPGTSPELNSEFTISKIDSFVIWKSSIKTTTDSPLIPAVSRALFISAENLLIK